MKIAVIGITGMTGQVLADTLLARGHEVTGISRNPHKLAPREGLKLIAADVLKQDEITQALAGQDVVINSFSAGHGLELRVYRDSIEGFRRVLRAVKDNRTPYLLHIGGAASLYVAPGVQVLDDPRFPLWFFRVAPAEHLEWLAQITGAPAFAAVAKDRREEMREGDTAPAMRPAWREFEEFFVALRGVPLLEGCRATFDIIEHDRTFNWSFLSPPFYFRPGAATGKYRTTIDTLPMENGIPAGIALPDLVLALADECEQQQFIHKHWSLARVV